MMTREELLDKTEKIAHDFESTYHGCAQCVLGAFREILGKEFITDRIFRAGSGLCGGVGCSGHACGTVTAGLMVISLFHGRDFDDFQNTGKMMEGFKLGQPLIEKTKKEYGSINCYDIQEKITGRHFECFSEEDQKEANEKYGLHTEICSKVVGKGARWTMEILIDKGFVNPKDF
ncbi:MAG: C_GCAxxG_C_C family protein [Candidatus Atribacteria bacterium]|nr:C_GCAxxG_C_C family protein [Candidatus Atribacteria bacterium]